MKLSHLPILLALLASTFAYFICELPSDDHENGNCVGHGPDNGKQQDCSFERPCFDDRHRCEFNSDMGEAKCDHCCGD
ncbi:unnamed protein product [Zymoseptoria tritici ST99CH_1A5]|uniref:Uncharacterized protein n=1 Tax=Zymoseptoria tritici ST99CH_1A5 TaxID=1276529 RepID=A0A1Y6LCI7_ZYMTR|nr:unnamed protein product [Zymoseptoria tritici ST99CH_1A5]